ncbi:methyltransferase [Thermosulfuriphilus ammonigenes]|uniref:Methyltransferase n=1 Tax=Thermosulfuriphilus ammonigenes TaxID=1936021 RepID=A0A6G7PVZ8_9BACT|nr:methyltransferase [Thermosulfuriphilus ammonigenes]MBA2848133.1 putative nicotinamide N-methyase [Thermosulfuriphilus ammonigenes]QIJ71691.1 methyltransferase [Thermosulfuriphilus ammonigenes]
MTEITIPESVKPIYERLAKRYELEFEPIAIRGKEINFLRLGNLEPLLEERDALTEVANFPFWVKIWEGAVVLADFMASVEANPPRKILEIGAGLGVAGLFAAAVGHQVTITDGEEEPLDFVKITAAVNNLEVDVLQMDWASPQDVGIFDMIIGAEVVYSSRIYEDLLALFRRFLRRPGGTIYLAHSSERLRTLGPFLAKAEAEYDLAMSRRRLKSEDESFEILLTRLTPKDGA